MRHKTLAILFFALSLILAVIAIVLAFRTWGGGETAQAEQPESSSLLSGLFSLFKKPAPTATPSPTPIPTPTPWPGPVVPEQSEPMGQAYFADAAFVGNSVTSGLWYYDTEKLLPTDTSHWYWADSLTIFGASAYVDRMPANTFGKVYIGFGINEVAYDQDTLRASFNDVIDQIQAAQPDAILYLMSVTPVSKYCDENRVFKRSLVLSFNEMLQDIARQQQIWYLDVYPALCGPDGYLPSDVTPDGVHFSAAHYKYWYDYMKTHYVPDGTPPASAQTPVPEEAAPAANG